MTALQLEALAMQTAERIEAGHRIEDSFIEAKSEWPTDFPKIARRLAAHANEMRGQPVVWVIGVNEDAASVPGAAKEEQGDWYAQVSKHFDQEVPGLTLSRVAYHGDTPIMALLFDTTAYPYIVRKEYGTKGFEHDVPMREGTRTRSAKRSEIVRLLAPLTPRIEADVLSAKLTARRGEPRSHVSGTTVTIPTVWAVEWTIYLTLLGDGHLVFPEHLTAASLIVGSECYEVQATFRTDETNVNVSVSGSDLIVSGPGRALVKGHLASTPQLGPGDDEVRLELRMQALNTDTPVGIDVILSRKPNDGTRQEQLYGRAGRVWAYAPG